MYFHDAPLLLDNQLTDGVFPVEDYSPTPSISYLFVVLSGVRRPPKLSSTYVSLLLLSLFS